MYIVFTNFQGSSSMCNNVNYISHFFRILLSRDILYFFLLDFCNTHYSDSHIEQWTMNVKCEC